MNTTEILLKNHSDTLDRIVDLIAGIDQKIDRKFGEFENKMLARFKDIDQRFLELEDKMLTRFDFLEGKIIRLEDKVDSLEKRTDMGFKGVQAQLDNMAIHHVTMREHTLLTDRMKKVERKVGIR
mgnify:CR=1 FL=1